MIYLKLMMTVRKSNEISLIVSRSRLISEITKLCAVNTVAEAASLKTVCSESKPKSVPSND